MILSATALLIARQFNGHLLLDAELVAKDLFGVSFTSAKQLPEFKKLLEDSKKVSVCSLANFIDLKRDVMIGEESLNEQMVLEFNLLTTHHTPVIPLETVSDIYLKMNAKSAQAKFNSGELKLLGLNAFRLGNSQKAPIFVMVTDLAKFILARRKVTIEG